MKLCRDCKIEKPLNDFSKTGFYNNIQSYRAECRICRNKRYVKTGLTAKYDKKRRSTEQYKSKRREKRKLDRTSEREYERRRRSNDSLYRLKKSLRNRLNKSLKSKKWYKNSQLSQYLGCSVLELKSQLELTFKPGMTWDNYGHGVDKWTIDHIIPLSSAKNVDEMIKLNHHTNLQPMWFMDNIYKSNKY